MKYVKTDSFADPDASARKLVEIANGVEAVQHLHRAHQSRFWLLASAVNSSAPGSPAPLRSGGSGGMKAAPT